MDLFRNQQTLTVSTVQHAAPVLALEDPKFCSQSIHFSLTILTTPNIDNFPNA
jgi:hypothetical protein